MKSYNELYKELNKIVDTYTGAKLVNSRHYATSGELQKILFESCSLGSLDSENYAINALASSFSLLAHYSETNRIEVSSVPGSLEISGTALTLMIFTAYFMGYKVSSNIEETEKIALAYMKNK